MRVNYLGPALLGLDHPALDALDARRLPPSCYLVEVSEEAGVEGEIIEGDVLVVDEARPVQHGDLVVVEQAGEQRLYRSHRIGSSILLITLLDRSGSIQARQELLRGVVVGQMRQNGLKKLIRL